MKIYMQTVDKGPSALLAFIRASSAYTKRTPPVPELVRLASEPFSPACEIGFSTT